MKKRNGFVSNSSSSSFIVCVGVVTDRDKFDNWRQKADLKDWDLETVNPWTEADKDWGELRKEGKYFVVDEPTNYPGGVRISIDEYERLETGYDEDIAILCIGNGEGDYAFYDDPDSDWPEMNYEISFDWFSPRQQKLYEDFNEKNGISLVHKTYGAGRNG